MSLKPTFVLVPGAWHGPSTWDKVTALLSRQGYASLAVTLPSTIGDPSVTYLNDINAVQAAIRSETKAGRNVIVVVHSYGGHVGSSALKGLPTSAHPGEDPSEGKVVGLAMMATGFNHTGMSFMDGLGGQPPPTWRADEESGFAVLVADPTELFYHDVLPREEAKAWTAQLRNHSLKSLFEGAEYAYAGWKDVPVWFLVTAEDHALPVEAQWWTVSDAKEQGADVTVQEVASGHSPMLSKPEETVAFLIEAAKAVQG
ncbi:alpha/beta-hydrolase [Cryphonectria parasitica EP155]|uniref:Alpha/beta-hydrolase n=1 Tax=Cryphonectria parasitica (strain ATCC 38755 / EP155) TaxID=660469 RepID=A0A9P4Y1J1_CRYP1|nr:alpha/beta-hydrolase [Cryphonectria parasitica EP155]KAF3764460.1 alpha/beta-hydrolase [Cryphonectria parasitica EP155]